MDEVEELKEIEQFITKQKLEEQDPDELEYSEFIDDDDSDEFIENEDYEIPDYQTQDISKLSTYNPSSILTDSEKRIVDMCKDPELKELLILNRQKNIQLMQFFKRIKDLLVECQGNIIEKEKHVKVKNDRRNNPKIWRIGRPYFKSIDDFPCPRNQDTVQKQQKGELLYYDIIQSVKWCNNDAKRLKTGVAFQYKIIREEEHVKQAQDVEKNVDVNREKLQMKDEVVDALNVTENIYPPLDYDKPIDWFRISQKFLCDKYSSQDCEIFWKVYLHPDINKNQWFAEEDKKLKALVAKHNLQNWDAIAKELGNNRTGFIACIHYHRNISPPKDGRFSPAEDKLMCDLVKVFKQGSYVPWTRIAHHFKNRTRGQLYYRYKYFLSCNNYIVRKKFAPAEDVLLMVLVDRFGRHFSQCQKYFPNRSVIQLKARYNSHLRVSVKKIAFSLEEDQTLMNYVNENGPTLWMALGRILGRSGQQVRQRYRVLNDYFNANPDANLEDAPRRRRMPISIDKEFEFLRCIANSFKTRKEIPTMTEIEKVLSVNNQETAPLHKENKSNNPSSKAKPPNKQGQERAESSQNEEATESPHMNIDDVLTDFFSSSMKLNSQKSIDHVNISQATNAVRTALSILQAELYIPKEFTNIPTIDDIDFHILSQLTSEVPTNSNSDYVIKRKSLDVDLLVPPNLYTAVGIRSLLIKTLFNPKKKSSSSNGKNIQDDPMLWCITTYLSNASEAARNQLKTERNLFYKRLVSVLKFPAILTLQKPPEPFLNSIISNTDSDNGCRTYRRKCIQKLTGRASSKPSSSGSVNTLQQPPESTLNSISSNTDTDTEFGTYHKKSNRKLTEHASAEPSSSGSVNTCFETILIKPNEKVIERLTIENSSIECETEIVLSSDSEQTGPLVEASRKDTRRKTKKNARHSKCPSQTTSENPLLNIDDLLTDFFSSALKLCSQNRFNRDHIGDATGVVTTVLSILQAELLIPKDIKDIPALDLVDHHILKSLKSGAVRNEHDEYVIGSNGSGVNSLIPPNLYTAVGMRSLLIKNHIYKSNRKKANSLDNRNAQEDNCVSLCVTHHRTKKAIPTHQQLEEERNVFYKRLVSIFKIPAIMTLQKPPEVVLKSHILKTGQSDNVIRTYRKKSNPKTTTVTQTEPSTSASAKNYIKEQTECAESSKNLTVRQTMAEQLKRRINDTIKTLSMRPPPKKFCSPAHKVNIPRPTNINDSFYSNIAVTTCRQSPRFSNNINDVKHKEISDGKKDLDDLNALNAALKTETYDSDESFNID